ncbi:anti-sigma regulatory factor (Ser/Thr protein kinase) [Streptomyces sp. SLBN-118]|uniref:ATP-binding protein n=1 Tax=Streptomyces sp. SLBN-118 TaxID=2768454 RepID=UPI0011526DD9|nr:ATP-binding protein [Streptomyces sp. SLBN-118]TQK44185.1 anti-sigma regulatory factor (Ser/Thr protein kinase) [Streptomyces sp. SLBN-118]
MNHVTDCPPAEISESYRAGFTLGEHSARHLRRILRAFLTRWEMPGLSDAAELALTELVANVVRHVPGRRCTLLILRRPDGLRVEVGDEHPRCPRPVRPGCGGDELDEGGRGLMLVEAVTDRWGVIPVPGGKTMWFECDA